MMPSGFIMSKLPDDSIGVINRMFDFSRVRIPLSTFLLSIIKYYKVRFSQLGPLGSTSDEFPLPEQLPTAYEDKFPLLIQSDATAERIALLLKTEFGDSYEAPDEVVATGLTTEGTSKKKGRTVALTAKDMQKRKNDVKARTTLLLALLDKHQLRFSKYKTAQELWAAILKTFLCNEATKKTKKNLLKQ
nr:hypothetical protein [Tanacetum cinerariifolium]